MHNIQIVLYKFGYQALCVYWFLFRPKTYGVRCIVRHDSNVLLIQHTYGSKWWMLPGGGIQQKETPKDAALRELLEEVGVVADEIKELGVTYSEYEYKKDTVYVFEITINDDGFVIQPSEIAEAKWFPLDTLPEYISPRTVECLELMNKK